MIEELFHIIKKMTLCATGWKHKKKFVGVAASFGHCLRYHFVKDLVVLWQIGILMVNIVEALHPEKTKLKLKVCLPHFGFTVVQLLRSSFLSKEAASAKRR
jgi:hypothetical protein